MKLSAMSIYQASGSLLCSEAEVVSSSWSSNKLANLQTCCEWSLRPLPPPAHTTISGHTGTPHRTSAIHTRDMGKSNPCSLHPDSHRDPFHMRSTDLCCHTLYSWEKWSVCRDKKDGNKWGKFIQNFFFPPLLKTPYKTLWIQLQLNELKPWFIC